MRVVLGKDAPAESTSTSLVAIRVTSSKGSLIKVVGNLKVGRLKARSLSQMIPTFWLHGIHLVRDSEIK